jgi:methylated-DNA-protein-cysteine methyltransferase-like protein
VVNRLGEISPRSQGDDHHQRERLEEEGVLFDGRGRIDLERYRWELGWESGPEERR